MELITQFAVVLGTLALLWLALRALRGLRTESGTGKSVQVRQRISAGNGCQLIVLEWHGEEFLLALGNHSCSLVAQHRNWNQRTKEEVSGAWVR